MRSELFVGSFLKCGEEQKKRSGSPVRSPDLNMARIASDFFNHTPGLMVILATLS
jgi:hypothetical protein